MESRAQLNNVIQGRQVSARSLLVDANAVLLAQDFNLSIFKPLWLREKEILREEELTTETVIAPGVIQIPTEQFELIVVPNRVQVRFRPNAEKPQDDLLRVVGGIARMLPYTPYTALGFNFTFFMEPPLQPSFADWNRAAFSGSCVSEVSSTRNRNARFGCYASFDTLGMRLKMDGKPAIVTAENKGEGLVENRELMQFSFNFHFDIPQPPSVEVIVEQLGKWSEASAVAEDTVKTLERCADAISGRE